MRLDYKYNKDFTPIEPDIYEKLNWDYDLIVLCLEYIRTEIHTILETESDKIETFLISFSNFLGQNYPAIGIRNKSDTEDCINLDFFEVNEKIEKWILSVGIETLKHKAQNITYINWKTLHDLKRFPNA
ncbi:hypothetical protein [Flavobacterium nitrogenifigens]|uniref:Uncharacterized protein n=1 Tax=Flavobacterium nitrogenifigens TaxID=1617283 RepID=A0A521ALV1_9FLAO|nr:hypothetical protein [Flavobacterium nitrogenifigens]KAF2340139.1 hypothetical protein DM397_00535 [Flavobacterium nitrogenifigens]SMO35814.1 hypothetical protein SAMN06265220_101268 [Flavobacterium nitrogenifigens]SMO35818.1 hypothetical protein SAMN06265220_101271 [Flavobacterium nitrogenifigens]